MHLGLSGHIYPDFLVNFINECDRLIWRPKELIAVSLRNPEYRRKFLRATVSLLFLLFLMRANVGIFKKKIKFSFLLFCFYLIRFYCFYFSSFAKFDHVILLTIVRS